LKKKVEKVEESEFSKRFKMDDVVVNSCPATFHSSALSNSLGQIYITPNNVCFYSKVFGLETKKVFHLSDISDLMTKNQKLYFAVDKKTYKFGIENIDNIQKLILSFSLKSKTENKTSSRRHSVQQTETDAPTVNLNLNEEDWILLLRHSTILTFEKDAYVFKEGHAHNRVFQVRKGSCRVEKEDTKKTFGRIEQNQIFGEISYLNKGKATASVIANEQTELYVFEGDFLELTYATNPMLAARFFYFLSTILSSRLERSTNVTNEENNSK